MTSENVSDSEAAEPTKAASAKAVDDQLIDELVGRAQAEGLQLTGEGGLLQQLTKRLLESALEGEITDHLGYDKHDPAGRNGGNSRNGTRSKTVLTDVGPVEITVPRDRYSSFEPKIVKKRQKRLSGVDEMVISLAREGPDHRRGAGPPGRGLWRRGLPPDHLHHHRQGPGGHDGMAEPPARHRLSGRLHRRHPREDPRRCGGQPAHLCGPGRHRRGPAGDSGAVGG